MLENLGWARPVNERRVRFGYGADITGAPFTGFTNVAAKNTDFMIFGGDNVYADAAPAANTTAQYYAKYRNQWGEAFFRQLTASVPSLIDRTAGRSSRPWTQHVAL